MKLIITNYCDTELPLFDVTHSKGKDVCHYSHLKRSFTGEVNDFFLIDLFILRWNFAFTLVYNERKVSPIEAKNIHRSKMKLLNRR